MAGFQFDSYHSPFANSIASLIARRGDIDAQRAMTVGNAQATGALQSGNAWANAIGGIGQTVAAIPGQMQQQKQLALREESDRLALDEQKQKAADRNALDAAYKMGDRDKVLEALPGHLKPIVSKQYADMDASALKLQKARADVDKLNNDYLAGLGASVAEHGYDLTATGLALQHARNTYEQANDSQMVQRIDQIAQQLQENPDSVKQVVDGVIQLSPERAKMLQTAKHQTTLEEQGATRIGIDQQNAARQESAQTETARHNAALEEIQRSTGDRAAAAAKETARHNVAMEGLGAERNSQNEAAPTLTPDAVALTAKQFAMTGQLPPMGMGKAGAAARTQIINEAAKQYHGLDLASQRAAYEASKKSLDGLVKQRDAIGAFEETATKNLKVFTDIAAKVTDTGSPWLNKPIRSLTENVLGGETLTAYNTARRTVIPEFAKILSNPGLSGQLSDSARKEVEDVVSGNATLAQTMAAAKVLLQDVQNRRTSYDDQIKAIQTRIATPPGSQRDTKATAPAEGTSGAVNGVPAVWKTVNGVAGWYRQ